MKSILVLRHAKSSRKDPDLTDHDRPLNKRTPYMGSYMTDPFDTLFPTLDTMISHIPTIHFTPASSSCPTCNMTSAVRLRWLSTSTHWLTWRFTGSAYINNPVWLRNRVWIYGKRKPLFCWSVNRYFPVKILYLDHYCYVMEDYQ